jgi:hypothetical protein
MLSCRVRLTLRCAAASRLAGAPQRQSYRFMPDIPDQVISRAFNFQFASLELHVSANMCLAKALQRLTCFDGELMLMLADC